MNKILWPAGTLLGPIPPAMVSCGTLENPNVLTVAWTGIINSDPAMTYVSIRPSRHSHGLIEQSKEFVINLPTLKLAEACDSVGIKSGAKIDKFKEYGLTALPCEGVSAPQIAEAPVSLVCKVKDVQHFRTHDMFLAEIVSVYVDDAYLDENGKLCLEKAGLLAFLHGAYYTLGREIGKMGFSVNKKVIKKKLALKAKQENTENETKQTLNNAVHTDFTNKTIDAVTPEEQDALVGETKIHSPKHKGVFMINRFVKKADKKPYKKASYETRKKEFSDKFDRGFTGRLKKDFGEDSRCDFKDKSEQSFGDKSKRGFEEKPHRDFDDRPRKDFGGRMSKSQDDKSRRDFSDKPKRDYSDKPRRSYGSKSDRDFDGNSRGGFGDRPKRSFSDKSRDGFKGKRDFDDKLRGRMNGKEGERTGNEPRKRFDDRPRGGFGEQSKRGFSEKSRREFSDKKDNGFERQKEKFGNTKGNGFARNKEGFNDKTRKASSTDKKTFSKKTYR